MEFIRGLQNLKPRHRGCVATIGNFDGLHLGHRAILQQCLQRAQAQAVPLAVMLFEPQPQEFFQGAQAPARLMRLREKCEGLRQLGVAQLLCIRFNARFAALTAQQFIDRILVAGLGVRELIVGDDFRFGHGRAGDFSLLQHSGAARGFTVTALETYRVDGERVSSTRVRRALAAGEMMHATRLLGRPYRISGKVVYGDQRGRTIGVPTANVLLHRRVSPVQGVYIVQVSGAGLAPHAGVANIGTRPTVNGTRMQLEAHLFDFSGDLYRRTVQVDLLHKLRDEQRFASFADLQARIAQDLTDARVWLRHAS